MRSQLETELINSLAPYKLPIEDIKAQFRLILNEYEIESRKTEIIVRDEDKNNQCIAMFIASKMASGRTNNTLHFYKSYLTKILNCIGKNYNEITADPNGLKSTTGKMYTIGYMMAPELWKYERKPSGK